MLWPVIAWFVSLRPVSGWLIRRAQRTPYRHLLIAGDRVVLADRHATRNGARPYMRRWWLFRCRWFEIRIHEICSADPGRDLHNHPWPFRTIILRGGYTEQRTELGECLQVRVAGDTYRLDPKDYHRINSAWPDTFTMFITPAKRGEWGFLVPGGHHVDHKEY